MFSTAFTLFIVISVAIAHTLPLSPPRPRPSLDGLQVAIASVAGFFTLFTGTLLFAHTRMIMDNTSTIEEMGMTRMKARERAALSRVYGFGQFTLVLVPSSSVHCTDLILECREKRATRRQWDEEWGRIGKEGNLWWLGSSRANWVAVMGENKLRWFRTSLPPHRPRRVASTDPASIVPLPARPTPDDGLSYVPNPRFSPEGFWRPRREWPEELR
jgi:palmitoyltransferase